MQQQKALVGYFLLAFLVILLDQSFKWILPQYVTVFKNSGIILGLFAGSGFYLAMVGLGILGVVLFRNHLNSGSAILLGGAISNVSDRLRFGYVVDYIDLGILPVFNLADVAIVLGVIMMVLELGKKRDKRFER